MLNSNSSGQISIRSIQTCHVVTVLRLGAFEIPGKQAIAFNLFLFSVNTFVMQIKKMTSERLLQRFCSFHVLFLFVSICSHGRAL
jgi:succinate-acetate transporter protein